MTPPVEGKDPASWRLGFDIGGTFTDFVLQNVRTGTVFVGKELTTPRDPAEGVMRGLHTLLVAARFDVGELAHEPRQCTPALSPRRPRRDAML